MSSIPLTESFGNNSTPNGGMLCGNGMSFFNQGNENNELKDEFFKAMTRLRKMRNFMNRAFELNTSEAVILRALEFGMSPFGGKADGEYVQGQLHISKSAISQNLNTLEEKGLITRTINQNDKRKFDFELTDEGRAVSKRILERSNQRIAQVLELMGTEDIRTFIHLMDKLNVIIQEVTAQEEAAAREADVIKETGDVNA